jgi:hypothetical protein
MMTGSRKILSDIELQEEIDNLSDISSADNNLLDPDFEMNGSESLFRF